MAIPDYETVMLPVLKIAGNGQEHRIRDVIEQFARDSALTDEERRQLLPSGKVFSRGAAEVATGDVGPTHRCQRWNSQPLPGDTRSCSDRACGRPGWRD
jgi:restriction system protein